MKWLSLILISLVLTGASFAQDNKTKKETKEETAQRKKEERKAETDKQFRQTDTLLTGKRFVLEAQFLKNTRGMRIPVTSDLNFIAIDSLSGIIQIGSPQRVGYNGVGGRTQCNMCGAYYQAVGCKFVGEFHPRLCATKL